jgi:hypothetical protein
MTRLSASLDDSPEDFEYRQLAIILQHYVGELTPWEADFLANVTQLDYRPSGKQKAVLQRLVRKAPTTIQERLATEGIFRLRLEMLRDRAGYAVRTG